MVFNNFLFVITCSFTINGKKWKRFDRFVKTIWKHLVLKICFVSPVDYEHIQTE